MVLTTSGFLFSFGFGDQGQLGLKNSDNALKPTWVSDFDGVKINAISAGNFHSLVQTEKGDMYSCGLNKEGQLALGHFKSKTGFAYISCFAGLTIQKFFAGGNHSLFMIDEFMPFKLRFEWPAPLGLKPDNQRDKSKGRGTSNERGAGGAGGGKGGDNYEFANLPLNERNEKNQVLSNEQIVERILQLQKAALENAKYYIQVTYCDTTFCHRFIHFEVDPDYIEQFEPILNEYIDSLKTEENEGILHYHLQEMPSKQQLAKMDPHENPLAVDKKKKKKEPMPMMGMDDEEMSPGEEDYKLPATTMNDFYDNNASREKSYTLTVICDPEESGIEKTYSEYKRWLMDTHMTSGINKQKRLVINANQPNKNAKGAPLVMNTVEEEKFKKNSQTIGRVVFLKDSDIEINVFEKEMSKWAAQFYLKMHQLCLRKPRFTEMRPSKYNI